MDHMERDDKMKRALELLSKKTGLSPEQLQNMASSGQISSLLSSPKAKELMSDPKKLERMLRDPKIAAFLKNLLKGQDGNG